jgi:outer membrane protein assembly factor BamB
LKEATLRTVSNRSEVLWGGSARTTTYVSANQLTAQITAADVAASGTVAVAVANQTGDGADSNTVNFTIQPLAPLALNSISPTQVYAGGSPFFVTVFGAGFTSSSEVAWNGSSLPTTYVSGTTLRASVDASLIANTGTASITVVNPAAQGGTSSAATLAIASPSIDALSYQINPAHTGAVNFNAMSFPGSSLWSVNVGGPASYALIVGGKVFVTVNLSGNSELLALNAATGATLWGPIALAGDADATYDDGTLFVVSNTGITSAVISALDPATGNSKWSATVGGAWYPGPPVAADGVVYTVNGGLVTAYDETSGATLWTQNVSGTSGTVAVSVDGVYASAPCTTFDLQPVTGTVLWTNNTGCEGGGGATPVVANGVLYSPINGQYSGTTYDAETGAVLGNFAAGTLPAVTTSTAFMLDNSTLQAISRANNQVLWSFAGDGSLITAPIAVDNYVIVGSSDGNLYGLDASTGAQVWTQNVGGSIGLSNYVSGLAAGDGLLVVPAGNSVTAYLLSSNP